MQGLKYQHLCGIPYQGIPFATVSDCNNHLKEMFIDEALKFLHKCVSSVAAEFTTFLQTFFLSVARFILFYYLYKTRPAILNLKKKRKILLIIC